MSKFFSEDAGSEDQKFIPPDYSGLDEDKDSELPFDSDLNGDDDDDEAEEDLITDEELVNEEIVEKLETEKKEDNSESMNFGSGFGTPGGSSSAWSSGRWGTQGDNRQSNDFWSTPGGGNNNNGGWWNNTGQQNGWGTGKPQQESQKINRDKKIIFIDFFDGLMETYQSNGQPGFLPRAVYDLKPRFEVWTKLAAFSPDYVFGIAQKEFLNDINGINGWSKVLDGWCCCLSSFLRKQYGSAQILLSTSIYQPKDWVISSAIKNFNPADCIYIGLQSGLYNQSNQDLIIAQKCGIDYLDLGQLLNNMC